MIKTPKGSTLLSILSLTGVLALAGCSGMVASFPDSPADVTPGPMTGNVMGGHSPIIGAEIYVLQAGTAYNGPSANRLTAADAQGTDPSHSYYVLTTTSGSFSLAGDYTCTAGYPVYLAAVGGTTSPTAYLLPITFSSETGNSGNYTITFSYSGTNAPAKGSSVTFASGAFTKAGFTNLNGTTAVVMSTSTGKFSIASNTTTRPTGPVTSYVVGDSATNGTLPNPAVVNLAVVGNCPAAGNFAATVPFIFINEVSTVAAAYALDGFGNGPFSIGSSTTNLPGIQNATLTAGQMYNIGTGYNALASTTQGSNGTSSTNSNGVVPQRTLDTLGNILAACVDSANSSASASSQCTALFTNSKSSAGTTPTDTATAMFNIAANPGRGSTAAVQSLFAQQAAGSAPFTPSLDTAPNDFTVTIAYSGGGLTATKGMSPHSIAVDASGNIYSANYSANSFSIFSPLGVPQSATGYTGNQLSAPMSVAVDANTPATVWLANYGDNYLSHFDANGSPDAVPTYNFGAGTFLLRDAEFDENGNLFVTANAPSALYEVTENRSGTAYQSQQISTQLSQPYGVSVDQYGDVWVADTTAKEATVCTQGFFGGYGCQNLTSAGINYATGNAIDYYDNVWFGNSNGTVSAFDQNGRALTGSPFVTGSGTLLDGLAIDGADNVWVSNTSNNALYEFSNTYTAGRFGGGTQATAEITPSSGYTATSPDGIAVDGSGNVWYNSSSTPDLYEVVGAASPVVTPISNGIANGTQGSLP